MHRFLLKKAMVYIYLQNIFQSIFSFAYYQGLSNTILAISPVEKDYK